MGSNPGYLLKSSLLYQDYEDSDRMDRYSRDGVNHLFRGKRTNHLLRGRRSTSGSKFRHIKSSCIDFYGIFCNTVHNGRNDSYKRQSKL